MNKKNGFTLVELMIAVVIISILTAIVVSTVNQNRQTNRARDSVNLANLEKVVSGIEAYFYSEGTYPNIVEANNGNPLNNETNISLDQYLQVWPKDLVYIYDEPTSNFAVYIKRNIGDTYYKYYSGGNEILECKGDTPNITTNVSACDVVVPK